jgi:hypothetical protein
MIGHTILESKDLNNIVKLLTPCNFPWFIAGGYAIDLFLGRITRPHSDIDICVFRDNFCELNEYFSDWDRFVIEPSDYSKIKLGANYTLSDSQHELHFKKNEIRLEFLLTPYENDTVIFRRDNRIKMHITDFKHEKYNIPFVAPEFQLLYKAKYLKDKDDLDFKNCLPLLSSSQKAWLLNSLKLTHLDSKWLVELL